LDSVVLCVVLVVEEESLVQVIPEPIKLFRRADVAPTNVEAATHVVNRLAGAFAQIANDLEFR
jgi:hypothetical protein